MKISFNGKYKSLSSFEAEELTGLVVITGVNGSGKTQFLDLIQGMSLHSEQDQKNELTIEPQISHRTRRVFSEVQNMHSMNHNRWIEDIERLISKITSLDDGVLVVVKEIILRQVSIEDILKEVKDEKSDLFKLQLDLKDLALQKVRNGIIQWHQIEFNILDNLSEFKLYLKREKSTIEALIFAHDFFQKPLKEISQNDLRKVPFPIHLLTTTDMFSVSVEQIFYHYLKRRELYRLAEFYREKDYFNNSAISDTEFVEKYPIPWELLNKILADHSLGFDFQGIEQNEFHSDSSVNFKFIHKESEKEIKFEDLSSGEKTIVGLIIRLFIIHYFNKELEYPGLILLDEPDAHLHPSMSKLLIEVLEETFVKKLGMQVILTTHSVDTIAVAPEESVFELQNHPKTSLKQIKKSDALRLLTKGVPTLSIGYESHKQVFTESDADAEYYRKIYEALCEHQQYESMLYFMSVSPSKSNGGCDRLMDFVDQIRDSGNSTSYGILDWDNKERKLKNDSYILTHGNNKRYSLENYVCDPIYITVLLMELKVESVYEELGLNMTFNHLGMKDQSNAFLQKIADWFFDKFPEQFTRSKDKTPKDIQYLNGSKIIVPKWFLIERGHDIELQVKSIFEKLGQRYKNTVDMQKDIALLIARSFPLIPIDTKKLLEEILND